MKPLQFPSKISLAHLRNSKARQNVRIHFLRASVWALASAFISLMAIILLGWKGLLLLLIALPAGVLAGTCWKQVLEKHREWLPAERSYSKIIFLSRRCEPALYWLGFIGSLLMAVVTFIFTAAPPSIPMLSWLVSFDALVELFSLSMMVSGWMFAVLIPYFFRLLVAERTMNKSVSETLTLRFLDEYEYRKN